MQRMEDQQVLSVPRSGGSFEILVKGDRYTKIALSWVLGDNNESARNSVFY